MIRCVPRLHKRLVCGARAQKCNYGFITDSGLPAPRA
jgi:hypothetical protein